MRLSGWIWVRDSPSGRRAAGRAGGRGAAGGPGEPSYAGCCLSRCVRAAESAAAVVPGDSPVPFRQGGEWEAGRRRPGRRGVAGALVRPGPSRPFVPPGAAMGGPLSGQRGRQSGRPAPIGQQAGGGGARAVLPGGQRRLLFQEDLDALSA